MAQGMQHEDIPEVLSGSTMSVSDLPHDFLRNAFALIGHDELCACACTCKAWNELSSAPEHWRPLVQRRWAHGRSQRWAALSEQQQWKKLYEERHLVRDGWLRIQTQNVATATHARHAHGSAAGEDVR
jgi:hypothetical protein